ncbi:hypothetical protein TRSC58_07632 [Trypanosoma rangeli SC58]|uniref:Uncharacterized protein n=1 Tax=Trypanosoma rangeli SC58 TaxID=429131 RepID=A0A061IST0_TRYRA|nr:hypothetical protein TRSC58_07632 [Trypanosoma rangeli SC58]
MIYAPVFAVASASSSFVFVSAFHLLPVGSCMYTACVCVCASVLLRNVNEIARHCVTVAPRSAHARRGELREKVQG